jgi:hypothetical protein
MGERKMALTKWWRQHIELWQNSGRSQADYCQQQGLNRKTFSARLSEFRSSQTPTSLALIPVQVKGILSGQIVLQHAKCHRLELLATVTLQFLFNNSVSIT